MLLVIGKPAEFDENRLPLRGQCEPYSHGWRLRMFDHGKEELLYEDTYYTCRQIQLACVGKSPEAVRQTVKEMHTQMMDDLQETAALSQEDTVSVDPETLRQAPPLRNPEDDDSTVAIPRTEMEEMARRRRKDFDF